MQILHGTWIPQAAETLAGESFIQSGVFYLWVETTEKKRFRKPSQRHSRQLGAEDLALLLKQELGVQPPSTQRDLKELISPQYILLPSANDQPLPSLELSRYLEEDLPETFDWQYWQIDCYATIIPTKGWSSVNSVVTLLNDLHFLTLHNLAEMQLGADLLFWFHYTQALKRIIFKDQYIPALKYRELQPVASAKKQRRTPKAEVTAEPEVTAKPKVSPKRQTRRAASTRAKATTKTSRRSVNLAKQAIAATQTIDVSSLDPKFELYPAWELIGEEYESMIQQYVEYMPLICGAGFAEPRETPELYDRETLLRHFSECLLTDIVTHTPITQAYEKTIADSLLYACLKNSAGKPWIAADGLERYKQWQAWRDRIVRTQTDQSFYLCFQLQDPGKPEDPWELQLQVAPKSDPSLRVALHDYWRMRPKQQQQVQKQLGQNFDQHLLTNLGYAARIYPALWQGLETDQPVGINLNLEAAFEFLKESAWVLENAGYKVIVPSWWTPKGRQRAKVRLKAKGKSLSGGEDKTKKYFSFENLVEYQYELAIGGEPVNEQEWNQLVNAKTPLVKFRGQWMELDQDKMRQMLEFWKAQQQENPELSLLDFLKLTAGGNEEVEVQVDRQDALSEMLAKLSDKNQLHPIQDPKHLQGNLREYQKRGVSWLQYLEEMGLNGCLADDMGLGKTIQVIARMLQERELAQKKRIKNIPPTLLIAPTSVVGNWQREIQKFAPQLKAVIHHGSQRTQDSKEFKQACREHDIMITSFALARKDISLFSEIEWHRIVLDEAQNIKNPKAALTKSILKLSATHRLALTGTPIENRLLDLWSIFNFLNPGYLGNQTQFRRSFELPIQKNNNLRQSETLKKLVEPFILRRVKTDAAIIKDLPEKVEQKLYCNLTKEQASLYEAVVKDVEEKIQTADGMQRKGMILATLMKLKQICNHPMQFLQDNSEFTPERSHKLSRLDDMVQEAIEEGESMLIFTQFTEIGEALEKYLRQARHHNTYYLHGGTSRNKREKMIQEFQDPETEPSVFVLSLKAGGVGITLTKANHVFHFDRWWNPAVEDQATDRAFRIGQKKNVFVHKFVAMGTLEERIDEMIEDKKKLAGAIVGADESWLTELDNNAFKKLIALNKSAIME